MRDLLFFASISIIAYCLCFTGLSLYYYRLRSRLKGQSFDVMVKHLGINYRYKEMNNGFTRYKWRKGWITIRADFDETLISYHEKTFFEQFGRTV